MVTGFFFLAATALFSGLVAAQDAPLACAVGCVENIYRDPSRLGCAANDINCACHSGQNFEFGVRDCIKQACNWEGATLDAQLAAAKKYGAEKCLPYTSTEAPAPAATTPPPPPPAAPATTPPAEQPSPGATTPAAPAPAPTSAKGDAEPSKPPASPEAPKPSATPKTSASPNAETTPGATNQPTTTAADKTSAAATNAGPSASAASTDSDISAATASGAPKSSDTANSQTANSDEDQPEDSSAGLSVAAKAGIGAGAGVAVVMMAITACCILMRRRKKTQKKPAAGPVRPARSPMPNISRPMGGGRQYAEDVEAPAAVTGFPAMAHVPSQDSSVFSPKPTYAHNDERYSVKGNRYEDMLPRTQPRTMI